MPIEIREATDADVPALSALFAELYRPHADALPRIYRRAVDCHAVADFLLGEMAREGAAVFVAEAGGAVAGYAAVRVFAAPDTPVHLPVLRAEVGTLVVGAAFRRRGVGEALMGRAHAWAAEHGAGEAELLVAEFNAGAIGLYEKLGYETAYRRMVRPLPAWGEEDGAERP